MNSNSTFHLIAAQPRSGSTLLLRLFNACKNTHLMGENGGAINHLLEFWHKGTQLSHYQRVTSCYETLTRHQRFPAWYNSFDQNEVKQSIRAIFQTYFNPLQNRNWGCKEIKFGARPYDNFVRHLDILDSLFDFRYVLLSRDMSEIESSALRKLGKVPYFLKQQQQNFESLAQERDKVIFLDYSDLSNFEKMSLTFEKLGLKITHKDFQSVIDVKIG